MCVGFPKDSKFTIDVVPLVLGSCKIIGSNLGNRAEAKMALNYVAMGKVTVEMQVRPLSEISDVYMELEAGKVSHSHCVLMALIYGNRSVVELW